MPRARKPGAPEPKRRSRNGCWPCKGRKIKCGEEHPSCLNCQKLGDTCDYSIKLNWSGRRTKRPSQSLASPTEPPQTPTDPDLSPVLKRSHTFPASALSTAATSSTFAVKGYQQTTFSWVTEEGGIGGSGTQASGDDGAHHVPRAASSSSLYTSAAAPAIPALVMPVWSIHNGQVEASSAAASAAAASPSIASMHAGMPPARHKRAKSLAEASDAPSTWHSPTVSTPSSYNTGSPCPPLYPGPSGQASVSHGSPTTPAASSAYSDEDHWTSLSVPFSPACHGRRASMNSVLQGAVDWRHQGDAAMVLPPPMPPFHESGGGDFQPYTFYGFDVGLRDNDIGTNDDQGCITAPSLAAWGAGGVLGWEHGVSQYKGTDGYYEAPVPVLIPRDLEPLPEKLTGNRMNLLYFHHFINHTARVLVPHDDLHSNPFRTTLPQMAVKDNTLLSLLLAYSASHRARILQQNEPEMRIATWVDDIFPTLRRALDDNGRLSDANLATAVMLTSLEIISPTAFGFDIPWQRHLSTARSLMRKRLADVSILPEENKLCSFLWSWLAYIDVLGSMSGSLVSSGSTSSTESDSLLPLILDQAGARGFDHDLDEIDCVLGFTIRCLRLLARVADLIRRYNQQRLAAGGSAPVMEIVRLAARLDQDLRNSMTRSPHPCQHLTGLEAADMREMTAMNEAFHLAGLVHLHRRVLGKGSSHPDIQALVRQVLKCIDGIRRGPTTEVGLLFPLFTVGCDVLDEGTRVRVLERFRSAETSGMTQVRRARRLMEKSWVTGKPWETLMTTEFIG